MNKIFTSVLIVFIFGISVHAQKLASPKIGTSTIPDSTLIKIVKAEDARDGAPLLPMLTDKNAAVRYRAALAAGRIGNDSAIDALILLLNDESVEVRAMAAFAIGEVESPKGSDAIVKLLDNSKTPDAVMARAVEAAGKIAAANPRDAKSKDLGDAILDVLDYEIEKGDKQYTETIRLGITGILRARPNEGDLVAAKFLTHRDARVRADAANTLTRLRSKRANLALREILTNDTDANARANAARALGAAEDKESFALILGAAANDKDSRVRVSAIRSLGSLKDTKAVDKMIEQGRWLLTAHKRSKRRNPVEKTELLEIATALAQILPGSEDERAVSFLNEVRIADSYSSSETETAFARIAPKAYLNAAPPDAVAYASWRSTSAYAQGLAVLAPSTDRDMRMNAALKLTSFIAGMSTGVKAKYQSEMLKAIPDLQRANAAFKPDNLIEILRSMLENPDVNVRAAAADLIANQPSSVENVDALKKAFSRSLIIDKQSDDAQLGIMAALFKLDKKGSVGTLLTALNAPNYLVRRRAFQMLADPELQKASPGIATALENARKDGKDHVLPFTPIFGTRLGQVLHTDADYRRALSRRNGTVRAIFTTEKGSFTIDLKPENAPLTVDNFIKLARARYFNGAEVHRVVANFVMQDGDPTGTGNGGPGHSIRCEINMLEFDRGAVGMALSGKDTGGSQWFVDHSPQPHLDGGYTVFGHVNETGMKVVDNIVRGDKILTVRIVEGGSPRKGAN